MQKTYHGINLIQKIVDESFFVETRKGKFRVINGDWIFYPNRFFYVEDVIKAVIKLIEINNTYQVDLNELHDMLYADYIDDKEILNAIKSQK